MGMKNISIIVLSIIAGLLLIFIVVDRVLDGITDPENPVELALCQDPDLPCYFDDGHGNTPFSPAHIEVDLARGAGTTAEDRFYTASNITVIGAGTSEDDPIYVSSVSAQPTIPPTPHGHDPNTERARLAHHYDTIDGFANASYQIDTDGNPFVYADFDIAGSVSNDGWHLTFPACVQTTGYPWTRYAFGWPARLDALVEINVGGLNQINAFVEQESSPGTPFTLGEADDLLEVWVGVDRFDCRVLAGKQAILKEQR